MKQIKKLLALVVALAICAAFALPAMANEDDGSTGSPEATTEGKYTLTMNNAQFYLVELIYPQALWAMLNGVIRALKRRMKMERAYPHQSMQKNFLN